MKGLDYTSGFRMFSCWQASAQPAPPTPPRHAGLCGGPGSLAGPGEHSLGNKIFVFSAGRPSRLPDCGGRDAEPPGDKLPLLISFSQGDLDTVRQDRRQAAELPAGFVRERACRQAKAGEQGPHAAVSQGERPQGSDASQTWAPVGAEGPAPTTVRPGLGPGRR